MLLKVTTYFGGMLDLIAHINLTINVTWTNSFSNYLPVKKHVFNKASKCCQRLGGGDIDFK